MQSKIGKFKNRLSFNLNQFLPIWWVGVRGTWHAHFLQDFTAGLDESFGDKLKISAGIFNFTKETIPEHILKTISKGRKYIPHIEETYESAINRF